ncbi:MAG: DUF1929 domain-containing protein [Vitreoscilla sp.]|nr:DUF1929 domain-containing protein [Vitreoscilla sp.]
MRAGTMVTLVLAASLAACGSGDNPPDTEPEPPNSTDPGVIGQFGAPFDWPIISMHLALLPDGRVMSFGTSTDGRQGAQIQYNVWDPSQGTGAASMLLLPNTTGSDISCAGQALVPATGELLIVGGDRTVDGRRNFANSDVNLFDATSNQLTRQPQSMAYQRWYATTVTTADGEQIVLGGMIDRELEPPTTYAALTPEVYRAGVGWRTLTGATSEDAFSARNEGWYYPRAWLAPDGLIFMLNHSGAMFRVNPAGRGNIEQLSSNAGPSFHTLPSVMFAPGRILSLRSDRQSVIVDVHDDIPALETAGMLSWDRRYANATLLADGRVWVNGGSNTGNDLAGAAYHSEIWDPATGRWRSAASAAKARLYHSAALLLPDATVLTSGGGAPGPVTNLNAEIYHPPYLFLRDGSGARAPRPQITSSPTTLRWGERFEVQMAAPGRVSRVTLVRAGAATHAYNNDQRFLELPFTQAESRLRMQAPMLPTIAPPGFYLLFVFDAAGVPSGGQMIRLHD